VLQNLLVAGLAALKDYIALHTITCLVPAFFLAGAMVSFISKETVMAYMGAAAHRLQAFATAAAGSILMAACSCTIIPVASGLYFAGASVGAAFVFLWVAPASNVLALVYTGSILGGKMALVRLGAALVMAFLVGTVMALAFAREEAARLQPEARAVGAMPMEAHAGELITKADAGLLALLLATLLAPNYLVQEGPFLWKVAVWAGGSAVTAAYALAVKPAEDLKRWMRETWWFARLIVPFLLVGVFVVGVIGALLPEAWVRAWLGGGGLRASFLATMIGSVSYFATLTEAPFVHTLMGLGMGPGPALALLLTGPGASLPNLLVVAHIFGIRKAAVYYVTIIVLGTFGGFAAGHLFF
jgi:uncharacterized membrane protein YraQ (UPF0718 family)